MSILSDRTIEWAIKEGHIRIDPFDPAQLNGASYDLTLGDEVALYDKWVDHVGVAQPYVMDASEEPAVRRWKMSERGQVLAPGIGYLMHTRERIWTEQFVPVLDGKSSVGRLFIQVHITAGYGDPGFDGQYTLEVVAVHPVRIYAGMRIAQMRFHELSESVSKERLYGAAGHYRGSLAEGPVPSQAFRQFKKKGG